MCVPNPCQNEGKCIAWKESYTCTCAPGWKDDDCDKSKYLSHMVVFSRSYITLLALISKLGNLSTSDIDECASNPCPEDLICVDKVNEYKCRKECEPGYTGEDCEIGKTTGDTMEMSRNRTSRSNVAATMDYEEA